jgi:glycosyltransferase involved in cell wall biosynthesis
VPASSGLTLADTGPLAAGLRLAGVIDTMRPGGAERVCARLIDGVRASAGDGHVYELAPAANGGSSPGRWRTEWALLSWLRENRINVVHAHNSAAFVYALGPARLLGLPIVVTRHGPLMGPPLRLVRWADRLLPLADGVVVVAESLRATVPTRVSAERIVHIPNGVATRRMDWEAGRARLTALTGITGPAEWIVSVGSISPEKDQPGIVRAFARVAGNRPAARLVLVGPTRCERTLGEARRIADAAGLSGRINFVGPQHDLPALLAGADAFVLGSRTEAMPIALLEAMVQGCPIASTRVGDVPAMIRYEVEGLLVDAGDDAALGAAIARLLSDSALAHRLGGAARIRACESYSDDRMIREHLRLYSTLTGVRGDRS